MSWFRRIFGMAGDSANRDPHDDFWYRETPYHTAAGPVIVTPETAMKLPAVVDALNAVSQPLAHLPVKLFRRVDERTSRQVADHPLVQMLRHPAEGWTSYEWRGFMQWNLSLHNNAYARFVWNGERQLFDMVPLDPNLVTPERVAGRTRYRITDAETGRVSSASAEEIWHLKGLPFSNDGLRGLSPVMTNRETIAHALAVQEYGARFFSNDGQAGGFIEVTSPFKSPDDKRRFKSAFREARTGSKAHSIALLEPGMKFAKGPERNNEHAQFLGTRKEMSIEIGRIWHVPPHKLRNLENAHLTNIEQQNIEWVTDGLLPPVDLWRRRYDLDVVNGIFELGEEYFVDYNVAALLRGDMKSQAEAFTAGRNGGWYSANDIRAMLGLNPIEGGDTYLQPLNMEPVTGPGRREGPSGESLGGEKPEGPKPDGEGDRPTPHLVAAGDD